MGGFVLLAGRWIWRFCRIAPCLKASWPFAPPVNLHLSLYLSTCLLLLLLLLASMPLPLQQQPLASWLAALFSLFPLLLFPNAWALSPQNSNGNMQEVVPVWGDMPPGNDDGEVSFSITAFGKVLLLQLEPDTSFLAPGLKIQHIGRKEPVGFLAEKEEGEENVKLRRCFYSGIVNSQLDSLVAVSLCQGIHGSFYVDGDKYVIEPQNRGSGDPLLQVHQLWKTSWSKEAGPDMQGRAAQRGPNGTPLNRAKRFTSQACYVETLLVADNSMVEFYGNNLTNHILTLMSVAAQIYKHPTLKNSINLVVVKVLLVDNKNDGPKISNNAMLLLNNFCNWQKKFNSPSDNQPEHYDTAILLTREDFCGAQSCSTLGFAEIGTMCNPDKSCSVIEDDGLQAAYTLAHELGHVLSMPHDDSKSCERLFGRLGKYHMMAPVIEHLNKTVPWSPCSAIYITEFLDGGHGDCLLDEPAQPIAFPTNLPGQTALYNLDQQCQQMYGKEFQHCALQTQNNVCSQLWCRRKNGEQTCHSRNSLPWADGTPCGPQKMCLDSHCIAKDTVTPKLAVDGKWGPWSSWGPCSRTCEGGVHFSYRDCNKPVPKNGGKYCVGQRVRYESCNIEECPSTDKNFREQQCEKHNRDSYTDMTGNLVEWIPQYAGVSPRDRCKLVCRSKSGNYLRVMDPKVIDGTTCAPDTPSVCVHGKCVKAGCDHIIGSSKKPDKCRVCGGDSKTCRKISGTFNQSTFGYNNIVTIPAGATNIDIKQRSRKGVKYDGNYLALQTLDGKYLLNGNHIISTSEQDIFVKGTVLMYSGALTILERIQSFQQLPESIVAQVVVSNQVYLPTVKYTFYIPKSLQFNRPTNKKKRLANMIKPLLTSQWVLGDWSECSKSCSSGWHRRTVECLDVEGQPSSTCDKALQPEDIKPCSGLPCPIWQMGPWSSCSQTCGEGMRTRSALCVDYLGKPVSFKKCNSSQPPAATTRCVLQEC